MLFRRRLTFLRHKTNGNSEHYSTGLASMRAHPKKKVLVFRGPVPRCVGGETSCNVTLENGNVVYTARHVLGLDPLIVWLNYFGLFKARREETENSEEVQQ
jgi:hypothetical protein